MLSLEGLLFAIAQHLPLLFFLSLSCLSPLDAAIHFLCMLSNDFHIGLAYG
jgi:hypothetical protein